MKNPKTQPRAGRPNVIPFRSPATISQRDLEELIFLGRTMMEAREEWKEKWEYVRSAVKNYARIEPGVHRAYLIKAGSRNRLLLR